MLTLPTKEKQRSPQRLNTQKKMSNTNYWNRIALFYNKAFQDKAHYQQMYEFVRAPLNKDMHVLEIGTSTGMIAREIAAKVQHVEATDASPKMIAQANAIAHPQNIQYSVADVFKLPYDSGVFDCVIIANVLHIIPNPENALEEIYRVLKTNGILIAPTYLWKGITWRGKIKRWLMQLSGFPLYSQWDEETYIDFLENHHFEVEQKKCIHSSIYLCCVTCKKKDR